ncbi:uncharacterized protein LOC8059761 isoform X1 [Sorghum bicolor]|uniref:CAAX prenyl protease 2/Lysostaphin resistance protein A-like domain-containing protein n=1 Tax=Sorghum bicolor TaxID=4558 RepID=A0A1W0W3N8_SORBI|nr:uncharacterized protein LOC8059761 isoform X1 [Sorghum bicolor]OQU88976.1 hypothetical protein SORBI_3002G127800 [Sorghum bicolor]|eukprot:XP_002459805.2 uncharacterized protein LOC8059761 isoform X1 [Sorghum bicolor]
MLLLPASAAASYPLLLPARTGGQGGARIHAAKLQALNGRLLRSSFSTLSCSCSPSPSPGDGGEDSARSLFDELSVLSPVVPWEVDDIWRIYAGYFFILHIPLSFGGLGVVAKVLQCSSLDSMTTVISTVILQLAELVLTLVLLQYTAKPGQTIQPFFSGKIFTERNWVKETVLGFVVLMALVLTTSILADKLVGSEDAYDPILKEILSDNPASALLCFFLYCVIAPLSEETIYRGFLLTSLSSSMKWRDAVVVSSLAFTVSHLSSNGSIQLFVVGCITGLAYCRTGTLAASFTIHSLYNAVLLYMAFVS